MADLAHKPRPGIGVVVGRFQVPMLHDGHLYVLNQANRHQKLLVLVGVHPCLVTRNDPLDFPTRAQMVVGHYPHAMVAPLPDQPTDEAWSAQLDQTVRTYCPLGEVTLYCGRDGFASHYSGQFPVTEVEELEFRSGTQERYRVNNHVLNSEHFRRGVIYASANQRPRLCPTVDVALVRYDSERGWMAVLGAKKGESGYRFPGGFVDPTDPTYEAAARRECREEINLIPETLEYLGSCRVEDWRENESDRLFTSFFVGYPTTQAAPGAGDDLQSASWLPLAAPRRYSLVQTHEPLMDMLIQHLENR